MINLLYSVGDLAAVVIIARLLTFRRTHHRHRRGVSIAAWLLIALCVTALSYRDVPQFVPGLTALLFTVLAIALIRTGGNLAPLLPHRRLP